MNDPDEPPSDHDPDGFRDVAPYVPAAPPSPPAVENIAASTTAAAGCAATDCSEAAAEARAPDELDVIQSVREGAGVVSGVLTTAQQFASAVGVAAVGAIFFAVLGSGHTLPDYTRAMLWSASSSLLLAIVAVVISARLAQLTGAKKETQPVATMKVSLPRDH